MKMSLKILVVSLCLTGNALAGDFVKKLDIPTGYHREVDYYNVDTGLGLDCTNDGLSELIISNADNFTIKALDASNNYLEAWSFTGNPDDFAPGADSFSFQFKSFIWAVSGSRHAVIQFRSDYGGTEFNGVLVVDINDNSIDWQFFDYYYIGRIGYGDVLNRQEDLILNNTYTDITEIWGWSETSAALQTPTHSLRLDQNHPNPFNPMTTLSFAIEHKAKTRLEIHDLRGRLVLSHDLGILPPGEHDWAWRGDDNSGRPVGSGTYFYTVISGNKRQSRKMTAVR